MDIKRKKQIFIAVAAILAIGVPSLVMGLFSGSDSSSESVTNSKKTENVMTLRSEDPVIHNVSKDFVAKRLGKNNLPDKTDISLHDSVHLNNKKSKPLKESGQTTKQKENTQEVVFSPPTIYGSIAEPASEIKTIIPQNTRIRSILKEDLNNSESHVVHAEILQNVKIKGKWLEIKGASLLGQFSINEQTNRFKIEFSKLIIDEQIHSIYAIAIDKDNQRGLRADIVDNKHSEKFINGVVDTVKDVITSTTTPYPSFTSTATDRIEDRDVRKSMVLHKKEFILLFDFPAELIGALL